MKIAKEKYRNLIMAFMAIVLVVIVGLCVAPKKGTQEEEPQQIIKNSTLEYKKEVESLDVVNTSKKNLNLRSRLDKFDTNSIETRRLQKNVLYASCLDSSMSNVILKTTGVWTYNIDTDVLNYYKYPFGDRIWNFIIEGEKIFYVELNDHRSDGIYEWYLKKANLDFSDSIILKKGQIYNVMDSPFFVVDDESNETIFVSYDDDIEISSTGDSLSHYVTVFTIEIMRDTEFEILETGIGNHTDKKGIFLQRWDYTTRLKKDELIFTEVSYFGKETTYSLDLNTREKRVVYVNNELESYQLVKTTRTNDGYVLLLDSGIGRSKMVIVSNDLKEVNVLATEGYVNTREINGGDIIFNYGYDARLPYSILSVKETKLIKKFDFNSQNIAHFFLTDGMKKILFEIGEDIYLYEIE